MTPMTPTDREALLTRAIDAERFILRQQLTAAWRNWLELDLSMAQLKTLVVLSEAETPTIGDVAETLGITLPTASHLIERLVRAELAQRAEDPADRRRTLTRITPAGEALLRGLRHGEHAWLRRLLAQLPDDDLAALCQGLCALERAVLREGEAQAHDVATLAVNTAGPG
jgi:DNA-binding MarR family transcriptional regulator